MQIFLSPLFRFFSDTNDHSSLLRIFSLMAFRKCYSPQNICLVPTLTSLNTHCVEQGDRHAHSPVNSARWCVRRSSVKDLGCVTVLSYLYFIVVPQEVSRYSCCFLAPCVWIIESLLFNCIGHHLIYISMIRITSTHTDHFKHMQSHKLYRLLYICHRDTLEIIGWAELSDYNYLYYYGMSYLHSQIIVW